MDKVFSDKGESIRIAPLHISKTKVMPGDLTIKKGDEELFADMAPSAVPKLIYNGGALIENVEIFTIFWGKNWDISAAYKTMAQNINSFFTAILVSPLIDQLAEYNTSTPKHTIGHGALAGTLTITTHAPASGTSITDSAIQKELNSWISKGIVGPVGPNRLYFIYTDINVKVIMGGSSSCTNFCGYHNNIGTTYYAVMPFPSCPGCLGGLSALDALTGTSSHELCEAITDPVPGTGWYDPVNGENGDICAWKFKKIDGFNVQLEWSNNASSCV